MPTEAKRETVAELREELANARTMIVSEYRGLKVKEIAEIRRALRKQDVTYRVVKNRLMRIAAERLGREALSPLLDRTDRDRVRERRGRHRQGGPRRHPAVQHGRPDHRRRPRRPGDRRGRRHPARRAAVARGPAGQAGRWDAGTGGHARRPVRRPAAQPGLRPAAGRRPEGRRTPAPSAARPDPTHNTDPTKETSHGSPDPGRSARSDRQDDRPRAVRVHQALRGALRRDRRRPGRCRRCPGRRWRWPPRPPPPPRSRPSSPRP